MKKTKIDPDTMYENLSNKLSDIYRHQQSRINVTVWMETKDGDEEVIRLYDVYSDPFEIGDVLHIDIEELYPSDLKKYRVEHQANFERENIKRRDLFGRKYVKLISKNKFVKSRLLERDRIEIEYFCEFTEKS